MKIAALYDIHGNLPALEAVLKEVEILNVDQLVIGGDAVLGPMSKDCLDTLLTQDIPTSFIIGNAETAALNQMQGKSPGKFPENVLEDIEFTANELITEHQQLISNWPKTITLEVDGFGKILFCHATPRDEFEIFTIRTQEDKLLKIFDEADADIVICGHTHMQFDRMIGKTRVINAGSVGMPFGKTGADWLLIDSSIELRNTTYDLEKAAAIIKQTEYPEANHFAENNVLNPPSEEDMLEKLGKAELNN